jgi:hypothetical protein
MTIEETIGTLREGDHDLYPVASPEDILTTERALGTSLPASYRAFVSTFSNGAYLYGVQEVSAVGAGNEQVVPIQKIDRIPGMQLAMRDEVPFFEGGGTVPYGHLVPFSLDSNGNEWCFLPGDGEPAVAYLGLRGTGEEYALFGRLESFIEWLRVLIEASDDDRDEVIRRLYGDRDEVLYDVLMLG